MCVWWRFSHIWLDNILASFKRNLVDQWKTWGWGEIIRTQFSPFTSGEIESTSLFPWQTKLRKEIFQSNERQLRVVCTRLFSPLLLRMDYPRTCGVYWAIKTILMDTHSITQMVSSLRSKQRIMTFPEIPLRRGVFVGNPFERALNWLARQRAMKKENWLKEKRKKIISRSHE